MFLWPRTHRLSFCTEFFIWCHITVWGSWICIITWSCKSSLPGYKLTGFWTQWLNQSASSEERQAAADVVQIWRLAAEVTMTAPQELNVAAKATLAHEVAEVLTVRSSRPAASVDPPEQLDRNQNNLHAGPARLTSAHRTGRGQTGLRLTEQREVRDCCAHWERSLPQHG